MKLWIAGLALMLPAGAYAQMPLDQTPLLSANRAVEKRSNNRTPSAAQSVVAFWQEAGPNLWFAKDPEFDRQFRDRFAAE